MLLRLTLTDLIPSSSELSTTMCRKLGLSKRLKHHLCCSVIHKGDHIKTLRVVAEVSTSLPRLIHTGAVKSVSDQGCTTVTARSGFIVLWAVWPLCVWVAKGFVIDPPLTLVNWGGNFETKWRNLNVSFHYAWADHFREGYFNRILKKIFELQEVACCLLQFTIAEVSCTFSPLTNFSWQWSLSLQSP